LKAEALPGRSDATAGAGFCGGWLDAKTYPNANPKAVYLPIKVTVDTYGHLVPGGNREAVDRLDERVKVNAEKEAANA
jgi:hypothetical protein